MRLKQPFLKLPIRFDAEALAAEVRALPTSAWVPHPSGFVGNEAARLITPNGDDLDAFEGPMAPTVNLGRCNYVRQVMAEIGAVWGRSRFMGLAAGSEVPRHIDSRYYWRTHLRIHIPIITHPGVLFTCDDETVHMAAGECWTFDSFRWHDVQNQGSERRIHLVMDTVGGGLLPELIRAAEAGNPEPRFLPPSDGSVADLAFERVNLPKVMSPWEMRCHLAFIREHAGAAPAVALVLDRIERFIDDWAATWARWGSEDDGRQTYLLLLNQARADVVALGAEQLELPNGVQLIRLFDELIYFVAVSQKSRSAIQSPVAAGSYREPLDRPIFIVSTPRSGSTLLYEALERAPGLYSTGNESHWLIERIPGLSPQERNWSSNRLTAEDATADRAEQLTENFYSHLTDRDGRQAVGRVRMLEKTPKNALRVPFLDAIYPDANFIYLHRDVRETLYSMMEAWHSGGFRTYPQLPGWRGLPWSLLLVPGWQRFVGMQLPEIVAHQWAVTTETLLDDLESLEPSRVQAVDYGSFITSPNAEVERIAKGLGLSWDRPLGPTLPLSKTTVSRPDRDKWRRLASVIEAVLPIVEKADARAKAFVKRQGAIISAADDVALASTKSAASL